MLNKHSKYEYTREDAVLQFLTASAFIQARKYFVSPVYDAASRTFRGTIFWGINPLSGHSAYWKYEMVFSPDLQSIESGEVRSFRLDGTEDREPVRFGVDLIYESCDLIYDDLFPMGLEQ